MKKTEDPGVNVRSDEIETGASPVRRGCSSRKEGVLKMEVMGCLTDFT